MSSLLVLPQDDPGGIRVDDCRHLAPPGAIRVDDTITAQKIGSGASGAFKSDWRPGKTDFFYFSNSLKKYRDSKRFWPGSQYNFSLQGAILDSK